MHSFSILAGLTALATTALAGKATINNHCSAPVYLWTAGDNLSGMTTIASGASYDEAYQTRAFGGISMKLAKSTDIWGGIDVAQVEYTAQSSALWYDLSLIGGDPFADDRTVITPQADESNSCTKIECPAGLNSCADAYMHSDDNWATHSCAADTDIVVDLCAPSTESKRDVEPVARSHPRDWSA